MMHRKVLSVVLPLMAVLALPALPVHRTASADMGVDLRGPAFSDPSSRVAMPPQWERQPILYESWAEGADLAVSLDQHL
jgi:hypothetical protein